MCLAIPTEVLEVLPDGLGRVMLGGVELAISLELVDDVQIGDFVIVHVGHAIAKLDRQQAEQTLALLQELVRAGDG